MANTNNNNNDDDSRPDDTSPPPTGGGGTGSLAGASQQLNNENDERATPKQEQNNNSNNNNSRKPYDTALRQQRMKAWQPILDPWYVVSAMIILGIAFLVAGIVLERNNEALVELSSTYDASPTSIQNLNINCSITKANANQSCIIEFIVPKDMNPPILVHYEITNFYQNHRRYVRSRDDVQLRGEASTELGKSRCTPLYQLGNQTLNPCGLIANTLFNDVITLRPGSFDLYGNPLYMNESGIAWETDLQYKFHQVQGFRSRECQSCEDEECDCGSSNNAGGEVEEWSCKVPYKDENGICHLYYYPNDDSTTYLYETVCNHTQVA